MPLRKDITLGALIRYRVTGPLGDGFPEEIDQDFPAMVIAIDSNRERVVVRVFNTFRDYDAYIPFALLQEPEPEPAPPKGEPVPAGEPLEPEPEIKDDEVV